jgi:hypothetical protein
MSEYHIGKEIEKEVRKQYSSIDAFAKALNVPRQTVCDMFKWDHAETDLLMKASKVLKRNFFQELSDIYANGMSASEAEDNLSLLAPANKLHVVNPSQVGDVANEYFSVSRKKPLLVIIDNGMNTAQKEIRRVGDIVFGKGMTKYLSIKEGEELIVESHIQELAALPQKAIELWLCFGPSCDGNGCDRSLLLAEKLIAATGKFVYIFARHRNTVGLGYDDNGWTKVIYNDGVERCFNAWHDREHIFVADNGDVNTGFLSNQRLYGSYNLCKQLMWILRDVRSDEHVKFELLLDNLPEQNSFEITHEDLDNKTTRFVFAESGIIPHRRDLFEGTNVTLYKKVTFDVLKDSGEICDAKAETY